LPFQLGRSGDVDFVQVYQVIRKIADERTQYGESAFRLSFAVVYDEIKRSNSSLNRRNKKLLEDSIERVIESIQQEHGDDSPSDASDIDILEDEGSVLVKPPSNGLNRSIVGMWSTASGTQRSATPKLDGDSATNASADRPAQDGAVPMSNKRRQANGEPPSKRRKAATATAIDKSPPTHLSLADVGGVDEIIQQFEDLLVLPMTRPEIYASSKVQPPRGVLIHGPPGCGKTMIANAFAAELGVNFISIAAPSIVSGMSGESEKALRDHFEEAMKCAPCLIFIDEIDAITPKRESAQREMEKRIVAQLLTCMDDLALEKTDGKPVIVLAATNRPDSLDAALRRGGRFDKEINMTVPSEPVRSQILRALTRQTQIAADVDFDLLAKRTPGFVGADLNDLVATSGAAAIKRYLAVLKSDSEQDSTPDVNMTGKNASDNGDGNDKGQLEVTTSEPIPVSPAVASLRRLIKYTKEHPPSSSEPEKIKVTHADFLASLPLVQPSALREGFATIPTTTFAEVGALHQHRTELFSTIIQPILDPGLYARVGITAPSGLLLWGPPGCGKTLLAKAVANESKANFISVKGPELLNKYVGESERAVRQVFVRARSSVPVVIFFDELDALVPRRDGTMSEASARVVNTLLTELDGAGSAREGIYIIAATNRPDMIDPAILRPGRLETLLFVGLPSATERVEIFRTLVRRSLSDAAFTDHMADMARTCEGFSGADLEALLRRAGYASIWKGSTTGRIELEDFEKARQEVRRSVTGKDMIRYERLRAEWGDGRGVAGAAA
jgi:ribosome biogenesis ATPase